VGVVVAKLQRPTIEANTANDTGAGRAEERVALNRLLHIGECRTVASLSLAAETRSKGSFLFFWAIFPGFFSSLGNSTKSCRVSAASMVEHPKIIEEITVEHTQTLVNRRKGEEKQWTGHMAVVMFLSFSVTGNESASFPDGLTSPKITEAMALPYLRRSQQSRWNIRAK
jgi:hypothetical protein